MVIGVRPRIEWWVDRSLTVALQLLGRVGCAAAGRGRIIGVMGVEGRWWFGVLGPLEASCGGAPVRLGGERQRVLLALLLARVNELVRVEQLVEQLFGEKRSDSAVNAVQVAVSRLRRVLEPSDGDGEVLQSRPGGYVLRAEPGQLDAAVFERLLGEGRGLFAAGQAAAAAGRPAGGVEVVARAGVRGLGGGGLSAGGDQAA